LNSLIFVFLFILFMVLRTIMAKGQSGQRKRRGKAALEDSSPEYAVPPADRDDGGIPPSYVPPWDIPNHPAERFLRDTAMPISRDPIYAIKSSQSASKKPLPQKLDYLPPLKRAVALAEILGRPKGL
jgi:hypothetical protein